MTTTPTLGDTVLWCSDEHLSGRNFFGAGQIFPALVTRVLDPNTLNLTVFPDGGMPVNITNASLDTSQTNPNSWAPLTDTTSPLEPRVAALEARTVAAAQKTAPTVPNTNSLTPIMAGLALIFLPQFGARGVLTLCGQIGNTTNAGETILQLYIGNGSPPSYGDPPTGTPAGTPVRQVAARTNDVGPFSQTVLLTDLAIGNTYWCDAAINVTGGNSILSNVDLTAFELTQPITPTQT